MDTIITLQWTDGKYCLTDWKDWQNIKTYHVHDIETVTVPLKTVSGHTWGVIASSKITKIALLYCQAHFQLSIAIAIKLSLALSSLCNHPTNQPPGQV